MDDTTEVKKQIYHEATKLVKKLVTLLEEFADTDEQSEEHPRLAQETQIDLQAANLGLLQAIRRIRESQ